MHQGIGAVKSSLLQEPAAISDSCGLNDIHVNIFKVYEVRQRFFFSCDGGTVPLRTVAADRVGQNVAIISTSFSPRM